ncbi:hypothetical protein Tco_0103641 [Tanacetum coccineum]
MTLTLLQMVDLRRIKAKNAWETIEHFSQWTKIVDKPFKAISEIVMVKISRCMSWLGSNDTYDEPIGNLDKMEDEIGNPSPQSTPQVLSSFEVYIPSLTYLEKVEETLGISMKVEPLDETQLKDLGLNTCNHDIPLSSREVPSFDELEPQPKPLRNCPSLDVSLGEERGPEPPIKPNSPESFRMKVVDHLTIHTPPSPHATSFYPRDVYCYYHTCLDDPKKHYGFKSGLLGQSGFLGVDFSDLEVIENDFLGGLNLPMEPKELEKGRKAHLLEDKQILSVWVFDEHLEEIHVTWAHLRKKRTRLQLYTKVDEKKGIQTLEMTSQFLATALGRSSDIVRNLATASGLNRLKEALEDLAGRQRHDFKATLSRLIYYIYKLSFRVLKSGTWEKS